MWLKFPGWVHPHIHGVLTDTFGAKTSHKYSKLQNVPNETHGQKRHIQNPGTKTAHRFSMHKMSNTRKTMLHLIRNVDVSWWSQTIIFNTYD